MIIEAEEPSMSLKSGFEDKGLHIKSCCYDDDDNAVIYVIKMVREVPNTRRNFVAWNGGKSLRSSR